MEIPLILYDRIGIQSTSNTHKSKRNKRNYHRVIIGCRLNGRNMCCVPERMKEERKKRKCDEWIRIFFGLFLFVLSFVWWLMVVCLMRPSSSQSNQSNFSHKICISFLNSLFFLFVGFRLCFIFHGFYIVDCKFTALTESYDILLLSFKSILLIC